MICVRASYSSTFYAEKVNFLGLCHPTSQDNYPCYSVAPLILVSLNLIKCLFPYLGKQRHRHQQKAIDYIGFAFAKICHFAICRQACSVTVGFV